MTHTGTLIAPDGDRHPTYFYIGREDEVISAVQTRNADKGNIRRRPRL